MSANIAPLLRNYDSSDVLQYLILLDWQLSAKSANLADINYLAAYDELVPILNVFCRPAGGEKLAGTDSEASGVHALDYSPNVAKMLAKNLTSVLKELPSKVYDLANQLIGFVAVDEDGSLSVSGKVACLVLSDIVEHYPLQVTSLIEYTTNQIYKILKKDPAVDPLVVHLASVLLGIALKSDISDKLQSKLDKIILKAILTSRICDSTNNNESTSQTDMNDSLTTVTLVTYYTHCLRNLLILQTTSNYEQLLQFSASATSGSKMKPEALMAQQHQFQQNILTSHEKVFHFGFESQFVEVRAAMVDLVANLVLNFVDTDSFDAYEYLIGLYPLPLLNLWDPSLSIRLNSFSEPIIDVKRESNTISNHDSESLIKSGSNLLLNQVGCIETLLFYIQLEELQSLVERPLKLMHLLDSILKKFGEMDHPSHVQNQPWSRSLCHFSVVLRHVISELGSTAHEVLAQYIVEKFSQSSADSNESRASSKSKRESTIFGFGGKRNKAKGATSTKINLKSNPYQLKLVLDIIILLSQCGIDSAAFAEKISPLTDSTDTTDVTLTEEEENSLTSNKSCYISKLLISLLSNESSAIRNYSMDALKRFADINKNLSNQLILDLYQMVSYEFNQPGTDDKNRRAVTLFSHALALLALIKQSEITLLQNSTIAKVLSFCTQNLKSTNGLKSLKSGACWIILTSLVTLYRDSEFVKVNSSQFLVFWKNLLTSQLVTSGLNSSTEAGGMPDILCNLKLRTLSLACLLNYILALDHSPELSRQLQFFLVKSHKYLLSLESSIESVGAITSLNSQAFNDCDFNVDVTGNFLFSNEIDTNVYPEQNQLISLILYNKKLILQGFIKLAQSLKSDVNSSLVVFLLKVFSDTKAFSRQLSPEAGKDKSKNTKKQQTESVALADHNIILLEEECNYNFGVTSRFQMGSAVVDDLCSLDDKYLRDQSHVLSLNGSSRQQIREPSSPMLSTLNTDNVFSDGTNTSWLFLLESQILSSSFASINHEPLSTILGRYSVRHEYSPSLITSLVDLSSELLSLVFPSLSYKIQFSLLEQLKAAVSTKTIDPLRMQAIQINIAVTLNMLFKHLHRSGYQMDEGLVLLSLEIIDDITSENQHVTVLLAEAIGFASTQLSKAKTEELVALKIAKIVNTVNPQLRGMHLLSVCKIYQQTHVSFAEIFSVTSQLLRDSHPVMAYYGLKAANALLEDATGKQGLMKDTILVLHSNFLMGMYGVCQTDFQLANLRSTHKLSIEFAKLMKTLITTLGPSIKDFDADLKSKIFHIVYCYGLGLDSIDQVECVATLTEISALLQELLIFDSTFVPDFSSWFCQFNEFIIVHNMKLGIGRSRPLYLDSNAIFPFTTSRCLGDNAFLSLVEMTKVGVPTLDAHTLNLSFIAMELCPSIYTKELLTFWVDAHSEQNWFARLSGLFKTPSRKLVGPFLEQNYEQKLLPILQREKKKASTSNTVDFKDEESENIVEAGVPGDDKNQPINWEFKALIYDLIISILKAAETDVQLLESLKSKIQDIIRLSFLGTTTPMLSIRIRGIRLLDRILNLVGDLEDPLYPDTSILEQQQAQIISALIPCFGSDSDPEVIVEAITVSSKFINLPRVKFYSKQRILKTMIYLLEEILSGKFLKFVFLETMAEYPKKAIQLAILNCWAVLKLRLANMDEELRQELETILDKYSRLLVLLWILVLKDLSTIRYSSPDARELEIFQKYWLNFVAVLSLSLETNTDLIRELLQEETGNFFFVMFCQCLEALIRGNDISEVLTSVIQLLKIPELTQSLIDDNLFGEVVDLLDRLVLMENDVMIKCKVIDVVNELFTAILVLESIDQTKMLELMRVTMLPIFETYPFLRQDYNPENASHQLLLKKCVSAGNLTLTKKQLTVLVEMTSKFPADGLPDLLSCILYIFAKFYEFGNEELISAVLPHLKVIVRSCKELDLDLVARFYNVIESDSALRNEANKVNYIVTMMILATGSDVKLGEAEAKTFSERLFDGLTTEELAATCIQSIKSLIYAAGTGNASVDMVVRLFMGQLLNSLQDDSSEAKINAKLLFEIVFVFSQCQALSKEEQTTDLFKVLLPLLVSAYEKKRLSVEYLQPKVTALMNRNPQSFKMVVTEHLDASQRDAIEALVTAQKQSISAPSETVIALKSFGDEEEVN
ncbi:hypothetical protein PUMCH_003024 [Australozyma saopauloensis]|uniref:LAA1-like C-terminal TPR repeats domain-containing protein n=1 Tax=Australozyma saopauloensis TaxID=291208 RepID=A0AAX4HBA2_9ASCO|nr:hypothetical protein PUMCH_003024 [[Candida] saopauloensis]